MAKLLTPLNQAALKAEDFSKIERENKEISVSYDRGFFHHVKKALGENKIAAVCLVVLCVIITGALMAPLSSVDPDYMDVMNKMAGHQGPQTGAHRGDNGKHTVFQHMAVHDPLFPSSLGHSCQDIFLFQLNDGVGTDIADHRREFCLGCDPARDHAGAGAEPQ